jgi:hypothetical protein
MWSAAKVKKIKGSLRTYVGKPLFFSGRRNTRKRSRKGSAGAAILRNTSNPTENVNSFQIRNAQLDVYGGQLRVSYQLALRPVGRPCFSSGQLL